MTAEQALKVYAPDELAQVDAELYDEVCDLAERVVCDYADHNGAHFFKDAQAAMKYFADENAPENRR